MCTRRGLQMLALRCSVQGIVMQALELFLALAHSRRDAKLLEGGLQPLLHLCIGHLPAPSHLPLSPLLSAPCAAWVMHVCRSGSSHRPYALLSARDLPPRSQAAHES